MYIYIRYIYIVNKNNEIIKAKLLIYINYLIRYI